MTEHQAILEKRIRKLSGRVAQPEVPVLAAEPEEIPLADLVHAIVLRPRDAARLLGVCARTLQSWPIQRFEFRGVVGYRPEDLIAFRDQHIVRCAGTTREVQ